jgi:1-acyl-sn-glycerol-3-phosphate acyltransferase
MERMLRLLYQPYKWLVFIPFVVFSTILFGSLVMVLARLVNPHVGRLVGGTAWARAIGYITPMRITMNGRKHIDRHQSYVITSNHQSHFDILVIFGWLGVDPMWVMKQELRNIPFFGYMCEQAGMIYIDRSNTEAAVNSLEKAKTKVTNGSSVTFFPEGTRSRDGALLPFKKGAFKMALDLGLPILPVTIHGTRWILPRDTLDVFPGNAHMTVHPPVDVAGYTLETLPELIDAVHHRIASALPAPAQA